MGIGGNHVYAMIVLANISRIQFPGAVHLWVVAVRKEDRLAKLDASAHITVPKSLRVKDAIVFGKRLLKQYAMSKSRSVRIVIVQRHTTGSEGTQRPGLHLCPFGCEQKVGSKGRSDIKN